MNVKLIFLGIFISLSFIGSSQNKIKLCDSLHFKIDTIIGTNDIYIVTELGANVINYKFYYSNSFDLLSEYTSINGKINGAETHYFKSGIIQSIQNYVFAVPIGACKTFYDNGHIESFYDYGFDENDKKLPEIIETRLDTSKVPPYDVTVMQTLYYKKLNGLKYFFHKNGKIERIESYLNNKPSGVWKYFDVNGVLIKELKY